MLEVKDASLGSAAAASFLLLLKEKEELIRISSRRPSGSSIASSQQKANKHDIIFFERNGLRLDRYTEHSLHTISCSPY